MFSLCATIRLIDGTYRLDYIVFPITAANQAYYAAQVDSLGEKVLAARRTTAQADVKLEWRERVALEP